MRLLAVTGQLHDFDERRDSVAVDCDRLVDRDGNDSLAVIVAEHSVAHDVGEGQRR